MRSPEIGTFNTAPEHVGEELAQMTFSYEELMHLVNEYTGNTRGRARASKLAQLEAWLESQGADHETFVRLYEVTGNINREHLYGN